MYKIETIISNQLEMYEKKNLLKDYILKKNSFKNNLIIIVK